MVFSSGLGKGGKIAAWGIAAIAASVWFYMDHNRDFVQRFSKDEVEEINRAIKAKTRKLDDKIEK